MLSPVPLLLKCALRREESNEGRCRVNSNRQGLWVTVGISAQQSLHFKLHYKNHFVFY